MTTPAVTHAEAVLTALLGAASAATAVGSLIPGALEGTAAMNGSARGTALVVLVVALPMLVVSSVRASSGSLRARAVWVGTVAYLAYNAVMFCFATPFNHLFLVYVAMLGTAFWSLVILVLHTSTGAIDGHRVPARAVAAYLWFVVTLNATAWLSTTLPASLGGLPPEFLDGTGLTTNPVFVQDLAVWLPAMAWMGYAVWARRAEGYFLASAGLVFWLVEAVGVAVDQWWGHLADPDSPVVSAAVVPMFAVLALVTGLFVHLSFRWTESPDAVLEDQESPERTATASTSTSWSG